MKDLDALIKLYRKNGLRITPQRKLIFEMLVNDESHPTAEDVYQRLVTRMPEVSRSTVYNTLKELVALGELNEVDELNEGGARYDIKTDHHHHLYCTQCHRLVDIEQDFEPIELPEEKAFGYQINRTQVTFYGICPECQA